MNLQQESASKPYMEDEQYEEEHTNVSQTQEFQEVADGTENNNSFTDWKERTTKELVCSIQRRFAGTRQQKNKQKREKVQAIRKSRSFDQQLAKLIPEFEDLPSDLQKSCSLDQHRMKQILPFEALATLCPQAGASLHEILGVVTSSQGEFSSGAKRWSQRKMSAPTLDYFPCHRQEQVEGETDEDSDDDKVYDKETAQNLKMTQEPGARKFRPRTGAVVRKRNRCLTEPSLFSQNLF